MGWVKLQGSFFAAQNYQYLMIGNFFDDSHTDTSGATTFGTVSYYFIDDVCLSTDSTLCSNFTKAISLEANQNIVCYYASHQIFLKMNNAYPNDLEVSVYNTLGQVVYRGMLNRYSEKNISTNSFMQGLYLVEVTTKNFKFSKKILVNN